MSSKDNVDLIKKIEADYKRQEVLDFRAGDTVRIHNKIVEGSKERIQIFEGVVIKRNNRNQSNATFTVRKISYNIGVERTFLLHSPRIEKIEIVVKGQVRRSRLYYLRPLRGKATRIKARLDQGTAAKETKPKAEKKEEVKVEKVEIQESAQAPA
ncbi:UNVERIFIED_CONTAM: hypothetical protein GTU68_014008 [Idotea baltica]|nr:hypothetical protein [Idotea baltica]